MLRPEFKNECISLLKKELVDILISDSIDTFLNKGNSNPDKLTKFLNRSGFWIKIRNRK